VFKDLTPRGALLSFDSFCLLSAGIADANRYPQTEPRFGLPPSTPSQPLTITMWPLRSCDIPLRVQWQFQAWLHRAGRWIPTLASIASQRATASLESAHPELACSSDSRYESSTASVVSDRCRHECLPLALARQIRTSVVTFEYHMLLVDQRKFDIISYLESFVYRGRDGCVTLG
jgi:hypothetical protein